MHILSIFNATFYNLLPLVHFNKNIWYCAYTCVACIIVVISLSCKVQPFYPSCTFIPENISRYEKIIDLIYYI